MVMKRIEVTLKPADLAVEFCNLCADEQAEFFAQIASISDLWPNSGWCGQAHAIIENANPAARKILAALADHLRESGK